MKIFIGWSDETSHAIAMALGDWIPSVIQAVETYVSPEEARKGTNWLHDVTKEMKKTSLGILCVVPGNVGASWLNFEAGVLSQSLDASKVIPLLIDVERSDLDNIPLAQFSPAVFEKNDMYQIIEAINENTQTGRLDEERLRNTFDVWWPKLELDVESIRKKGSTEIQDADQPEKAPETDKPIKEPDTDQAKKTPDIDEPERTTKTDQPEKTAEPDKREKTQDTGKPKKDPDTDQQEKKPVRTPEAAIKNETRKTEDTEKPAKSISPKPVLEEIEIEVLKVLYKPPGYAPTTASAVGYKLDISAQKAREHLDILERKNYVREHLYVGRAKEYSIARKGKEYLTKHDLVNKRQGG